MATTFRRMDETHPGLIAAELLADRSITAQQVSTRTKIPLATVQALLAGQAPITPEVAAAVSAYFAWRGERGADQARLWERLWAMYQRRQGR